MDDFVPREEIDYIADDGSRVRIETGIFNRQCVVGQAFSSIKILQCQGVRIYTNSEVPSKRMNLQYESYAGLDYSQGVFDLIARSLTSLSTQRVPLEELVERIEDLCERFSEGAGDYD